MNDPAREQSINILAGTGKVSRDEAIEFLNKYPDCNIINYPDQAIFFLKSYFQMKRNEKYKQALLDSETNT